METLLNEDLKERIRNLLLNHNNMKDNDRLLMSAIWGEEVDKNTDFLVAFASGKCTNPESIRRTRQWLQEKIPNLRGKKYIIRKTRADNIRKEIVKKKSKIKIKKIFLEEDQITTIKNIKFKIVITDIITPKELIEVLDELLSDDIKTAYMGVNNTFYYVIFNNLGGRYEFYKS